jgi:hypothetical protein
VSGRYEAAVLTQEDKVILDKRMVELAGKAIRMLALCTYGNNVGAKEPLPEHGLTLVGVSWPSGMRCVRKLLKL